MDLFSETLPCPPFEIRSNIEHTWQWIESHGGYRIQVPDGEIMFIERFFEPKISDRCVAYFLENDRLDWRTTHWKDLSTEQLAQIRFTHINWKQESIRLYGKSVLLPRLTAWYGDRGRNYTYSGIHCCPDEWNRGLLHLKQKIEASAGLTFNSVLLNWYRNGEDHLHWHADDEAELGLNPVIASANFGQPRDFLIRRKDDHSKRIKLPLRHGTLLIMRGELQHHWQHSVPRRKKVTGSRFNLTFRRIGPPGQPLPAAPPPPPAA
ncbi:alpha-ketoglutarate-dependent dioxygenase AlkB [Synechococcus sp. CCAP 1479/9]|uniref:alpha-ketoglutarate-dependent dioxygenase AlkB family protein n=1 Tax=Synechococcus sp. CCAP 1479/9 TaxID=1221593 RepID=UPI001C22C66D|nr:alpha-ketoglutarate-dependent dioxygenase AlkB [Synechococcus sp. CCAP 1479/9]